MDKIKLKIIKETMKKLIPLYLLSLSSVVFNVGTIVLAIVILDYYAIIYFALVFVSNFVLQYFVGTLWLSKMESMVQLEFKQKEGTGIFILKNNDFTEWIFTLPTFQTISRKE